MHLRKPLAQTALALSVSACTDILGVSDVHFVDASAAVDGGGAGGLSKCDQIFIFCDGFENGTGAWSTGENGGSIAVDSQHVYRGSFALHSMLPQVQAQRNINAGLGHDAWPPPVYLRFFVYVSPGGTHAATANLLYLDYPGASPVTGLVFDLTGGKGAPALSTFGSGQQANDSSNAPLTTGQWVCLELEVDTANTSVWIGGQQNPPILTVPFDATSSGLGISLGLAYSPSVANDDQLDVWFDEFAVDRNRIYCDR